MSRDLRCSQAARLHESQEIRGLIVSEPLSNDMHIRPLYMARTFPTNKQEAQHTCALKGVLRVRP